MNVDGCVTIVDRKKDMILFSGSNVDPNEIESVVAAHPGVAECAAIGVPDEKSSKAVYPRRIFFRDVLPKNPAEKIIRRELRDEAPEDF